ncbi:unnamed protein product [Durusdinium trenchii]|uniref:Uncharacterized protein n=1 Tax=Durusdinium trenchii TaxID=1381693 RepID=A0ABP0SQT6_9DINO
MQLGNSGSKCTISRSRRRWPMNIGSLQLVSSTTPPWLFSDACLRAHQVSVDIGDLCTAAQPPGVRRALKPVRGARSNQNDRERRHHAQLRIFLRSNNFKHVDDSIVCKGERLYPIHVAAKQGKCRMLHFLVNHGVDAQQKTSHGRTAMDFAKQAPSEAREHVVNFFHGQYTQMTGEESLTLRDFLQRVNSALSAPEIKSVSPQHLSL